MIPYLSAYKAKGVQAGETLMKSDKNDDAVVIDEQLVNQLSEMGYPYHASRKALYHNNQQLEVRLSKAITSLINLYAS